MSNKCICEEGNKMPSSPTEIQLMLAKIKLTVDELVNETEKKLFYQDGKIADVCTYVKSNLENTIRCLLDSMKLSGELESLVSDSLLTGYKALFDKVNNLIGLAGTTDNRPSENLFIGLQYFDSDLNKPIYYNGFHWIDSTGKKV